MNAIPLRTYIRVDAQHTRFDGAFTKFFVSQSEATLFMRKQTMWGWLLDATTVEAPLACEGALLGVLWPVEKLNAILAIAGGKESSMELVDQDRVVELAIPVEAEA